MLWLLPIWKQLRTIIAMLSYLILIVFRMQTQKQTKKDLLRYLIKFLIVCKVFRKVCLGLLNLKDKWLKMALMKTLKTNLKRFAVMNGKIEEMISILRKIILLKLFQKQTILHLMPQEIHIKRPKVILV